MALVERMHIDQQLMKPRHTIPTKDYKVKKSTQIKTKTVQKETVHEVPELHTAFGMLDRNKDGHVYVDDIYDMMTALGHNIKKENISDFIKSAGNGGDSVLEHEFISWMETLDHNRHHDADDYILRGAFETFDKDKDGFISRDELQKGLKLIGENVSDKMLDLMMAEADKDRDGLISYEEFAQIMR